MYNTIKKHLSTIVLFLVFFIGLCLLLYPTVADWWNSFHQSRAVQSYVEEVASMSEDQYQELWNEAWEYNRSLVDRPNDYIISDEQKEKYEHILNVTGNGIMGYVEVPSVDVTLPVYHGTSEGVLQIALGHLEWSSLPVGGEGSHSVISGHRGLPRAKLFTDLDQLKEGDIFWIRILDEVLTYEVDQIRIVEPSEAEDLLPVDGQDYCSLVTCTPYGINSHRLLVRGHRIETTEEILMQIVTADAIQIDPVVVAPFVAMPMLFVLLVAVLKPKKRRE